MSLELKKRNVMESYFTIPIGYCDLQYLLRYENKIGYTCGVYGWNADIYVLDNVAIVTGYRPFGEWERPKGIVAKYEEKAKKIHNDNRIKSWEKKKEKLHKLLEDFVKEVREYNI